MYLFSLDGSANSNRITWCRAAVTTLWVGHHPTVLAAEVHLAELCSSSTGHTKFRLDHLGDKVIEKTLSHSVFNILNLLVVLLQVGVQCKMLHFGTKGPHTTYCLGDEVVFPSSCISSRGSWWDWIRDWGAGSLTDSLRLVSSGRISPCWSSCRCHQRSVKTQNSESHKS